MTQQVDIRRATFRVIHDTPGHVTYGLWVNGAGIGSLTVRQEERVALVNMLQRGGFAYTEGETL